MRISLRKLGIIIGSAIVALATVSPFWNLAQAQTMPAPLAVSAADLMTAGFHNVQIVQPQAAAYLPPNTYFHVSESVASAHPEWGTAANLVAVLITSAPSGWSYNGGSSQTLDISGRTQIRESRPGYYIVVTGPDSNDVAALAALLLKK